LNDTTAAPARGSATRDPFDTTIFVSDAPCGAGKTFAQTKCATSMARRVPSQRL
jgi:CRISPR/Cas system-associated endonuclease/helicase Cas3